MNQAGTILNAFGTYDWDANVYGALSVASRIAANVKNRANVLRLAYSLHDLNRTLTNFFDTVNEAMEGKLPADPNAEPLSPERLRTLADNVERLHHIIEYVYESLRRCGLTNNSLTAGSLDSIRKHGEAALDLADWFEAIAQPDKIAELFDRAKQEKERGELIDLARVR